MLVIVQRGKQMPPILNQKEFEKVRKKEGIIELVALEQRTFLGINSISL